MKRVLFLFIAAMLFSTATALAKGGTTVPLTWKLENGTLTISGRGAMPDYQPQQSPWNEYRESIYTIVIENEVTRVGNCAFQYCTNLPSITLPCNLTSIGIYAFYNCNSLTSITNLNSMPIKIDNTIFADIDQSACTLKVPMASVSAYKNDPVWKEFNIVGIEVSIENIEPITIKIYPNPTTGQLRIENGELVRRV